MTDLHKLFAKINTASDKAVNILPLNYYEKIASFVFSSGFHSIDLLTGPIPLGSWITIAGKKSSGKTTIMHSMNGSAMKRYNMKGRIALFDYENSSNTQFAANVMGYDLDELYGKSGTPGLIHRYIPETAEVFFEKNEEILTSLPDVVQIGGKLLGRYPKKVFKEMVGSMAKPIDIKTNMKDVVYFEIVNPLQYLINLDSFPEMLPEGKRKSKSKDMAVVARMLSAKIPTIRSLMEIKGIILIGINHIRDNPGIKYGSTSYTPCGSHLENATDIEITANAISIPHEDRGKGKVEVENNADGTQSRYVYTRLRTTKNKKSAPHRMVNLRLNIEEDGLSGRGVDKYYDVFNYLVCTGQCERARGGALNIKLEQDFAFNSDRVGAVSWDNLKDIVDEKFSKTVNGNLPKLSKDKLKIVNKVKKASLRKKMTEKVLDDYYSINAIFRKQLRTGLAHRLYREPK